MGNRGFLFGFGCGIIIMSAIVYFFYGRLFQRELEAIPSVVMTDEQVVTRAKELGMISYSELPARNDVMPSPSAIPPQDITNEDIVERALGLGMVFPQEGFAEWDDAGAISVDIPQGYNSVQITALLADAGIIEDISSFQQFLYKQNAATKLHYGRLRFVPGSSYEDILAVLRLQ